jgi:hypothetical protein
MGKGIMKFKYLRMSGVGFAGLLALGANGFAQEKAQAAPQRVSSAYNTYDVARESVLQGTVVAYTTSSTAPPIGAHVTLRTSSGVVDVHIGNAKLLDANKMTLQPGEAIKITGETVAFGDSTVFAARVIQKGSQTVAVRSTHGAPLIVLASKGAVQQGGVR